MGSGCFRCDNCGWHNPYYGRACDNCGNTVASSGWNEGFWFPYTKDQCTAYNSVKRYIVVNDERYFYWPESPTASMTQYSYRTRSLYYENVVGDFGEWGNDEIIKTDSNVVEKRMLYSIRWRSLRYVD